MAVSSIDARHPLRLGQIDLSASHADIMDPHCESVAWPREALRSGLHEWVAPSGRPHNDSSQAMRAAIRDERQCRRRCDWSGGRSVCPLIVVTRSSCAAPDGASACSRGVLRRQGAPPLSSSRLHKRVRPAGTCPCPHWARLTTTFHAFRWRKTRALHRRRVRSSMRIERKARIPAPHFRGSRVLSSTVISHDELLPFVGKVKSPGEPCVLLPHPEVLGQCCRASMLPHFLG